MHLNFIQVGRSSPEAPRRCLRRVSGSQRLGCGNVLRLRALEGHAEDPDSRSCISSGMEPLMVKRKSLAGKHRHEWKRGFLAGTGFPTFLRRANPPPCLEDRLSLLSGEDEALTRRGFKPESPSPEPDTVFPPPQRPQLSPGALEPRQESRKLLQAPRRHPRQGALPGQGAGEATRMREGEGHGPGIHFNSTTYLERRALHWALSKEQR
ncbi:uncharacterized protein LOC114211154 [Eumetopias jubatus]|uniref:uncharacterized protein LOC114211154 n=1 Tax=Eumetopias jubatus TaxID=34886 RepID=UPI001016C223|nr:uncharacterized protein LOC114211154 [Eumetopias jubatus]